MAWWKMSFANDWVTEQELRWVVITPDNPFGDITKEQYKEITGADFDKQFGNMSRGILKRFLDKRVTLTNLCTP